MRKYSLFAFLSCSLFCAWSNAKERVVLAYSVIPPYSSIDANGQPIGMEIDVINLLANDLNLQIEPVVCSFNHCLTLIERGEADLISSLLKTADRESYLSYVEPAYYVLQTDIAFYASSETQFSLNDYSQLADYSIAKVKGAKYFPQFDQDSTLSILEADSETTLLKLLGAKRVDLIIAIEDSFELYIQQQKMQDKVRKVAFKQPSRFSTYMAISKKSAFLQQQTKLKQAISKRLASGEIQQVLKRHNIPGIAD